MFAILLIKLARVALLASSVGELEANNKEEEWGILNCKICFALHFIPGKA